MSKQIAKRKIHLQEKEKVIVQEVPLNHKMNLKSEDENCLYYLFDGVEIQYIKWRGDFSVYGRLTPKIRNFINTLTSNPIIEECKFAIKSEDRIINYEVVDRIKRDYRRFLNSFATISNPSKLSCRIESYEKGKFIYRNRITNGSIKYLSLLIAGYKNAYRFVFDVETRKLYLNKDFSGFHNQYELIDELGEEVRLEDAVKLADGQFYRILNKHKFIGVGYCIFTKWNGHDDQNVNTYYCKHIDENIDLYTRQQYELMVDNTYDIYDSKGNGDSYYS